MSAPEKKVTVTDANGVPQFIAPIPARLPGKKGNKTSATGGKTGNLKRNHTSTRLQQLAAAAAQAQGISGLPRPVPIEPPRPASTSAPETIDYNIQLYCSSACARADERRASELEEQMNALWLQQTAGSTSSASRVAAAGRPGMRRLSSGATSVNSYIEPPSPLWLNTRGLAHASGSSDGGSSSNDVLASPHADDAAQRNDALTFVGDYFDMAQTGVERGLIARERRRSQAGGASKTGRSGSSSMTGPIMQRLGSNQSNSSFTTNTGYGYRANPISSSDSLSSMWSSSASEGRTFSDEPATTSSSSSGQPSRPVMRGLTPLTTHNSNPTSPVMISRGSFSGSRSSVAAAALSAPLRRDSMPLAAPVVGSGGSATAAPLFSDYAASFHRVAASSDLHPSPRLQALADKPRRDSSVETYATRRVEFDDMSTSMPRPRSGSSSAEPRIARGRGEFSPSALLEVAAPSSHDGSHSTPTQSLVRDSSAHLAIGGSASMARSDSRESRGSSHTGSDGSSGSMQNSQGGVQIHRKSTIKASSARQLSFSLSSKYSTPTRALSIGDDVVLQPSMESDLSRSYTVRPRLPSRDERPSEPSSYKDTTTLRAAIAPALSERLEPPRREWSYESLEQAGRKMYQLPVKAVGGGEQTQQRLFRFGQ